MVTIEMIKKQIHTQSEYLNLIETYLSYLEKLKTIGEGELLDRGYFQIITRLVKCYMVMCLFVLGDIDEDYSFSKLRNREVSMGKLGMSKEERRKSFELVDKVIENFAQLNLKYIRNKYCAHLDQGRIDQNLDLKKISNLFKLMCETHDFFSNNLLNQNVSFDMNNDVLTQLIDDNKMLLGFILKEKNLKRCR